MTCKNLYFGLHFYSKNPNILNGIGMQNAPLTESNLKKELLVGITFHRNFMS